MKRPAAEPENADVLAICEKLTAPVRPGSLQLAEAAVRKLRQEASEVGRECQQALHADWSRDATRPSMESRHLQAKVDELSAQIRAARAVVEDERKKWQPKFNDAVALPISAATEMLQVELARIDLLAKALLNVHTFAGYCNMETPIGRAPALITAVRNLRIALNTKNY